MLITTERSTVFAATKRLWKIVLTAEMKNKKRNLSEEPFTAAEFSKAVLPFLEKCFRIRGAVGLERGRARVERLKSEYLKKGWIKS